MKAACSGCAADNVPKRAALRREIECSYDLEADIYSAPHSRSGLKLLPIAAPAMMLALLAALRFR